MGDLESDDDGLIIDDVGQTFGSSESLRLAISIHCWKNRGLRNVMVTESGFPPTLSMGHEAEINHCRNELNA